MTQSRRTLPGRCLGRDGERTPMQWDAGMHADFSTVEPWLPLAADFRSENVENARRDSTSIYHLYRRLITVRRSRRALKTGSYRPIVAQAGLILFMRESAEEQILIALNLGPNPASVRFPQPLRGQVLVSGFADRDGEAIEDGIELRDDEGLVIDLAHGSLVPA